MQMARMFQKQNLLSNCSLPKSHPVTLTSTNLETSKPFHLIFRLFLIQNARVSRTENKHRTSRMEHKTEEEAIEKFEVRTHHSEILQQGATNNRSRARHLDGQWCSESWTSSLCSSSTNNFCRWTGNEEGLYFDIRRV